MVSRLEKLLLFLLVLFIPSQLAFHFWPSWSFVSGLPVDYLSPTLYFTDLLILPLTLLSLYRNHLKKNPLLTTALLILILNVIFSSRPPLSLYWLVRILEYTLLYFYLISSPLSRKIFISAFPWTIIWTVSLTWLQMLKQSSVGGLFFWLGERPLSLVQPGIAKITLFNHTLFLRSYATFPHPNALAGFLLVSLTLLIYFYHSARKPFFIFTAFLTIITLPLTFSRSAFILFIVYLLYLGYFYLRRRLFILFSLISAPVVFFYSFIPSSDSLSQRLDLLNSALRLFSTHPFLGVGLHNFIPASESVIHQPVHNIFALVFVETGIILGCSFLYLVYYFGRKARFVSPHLFLGFIFILATGLVDHYWLTLTPPFLFLVFVLYIISSSPPAVKI